MNPNESLEQSHALESVPTETTTIVKKRMMEEIEKLMTDGGYAPRIELFIVEYGDDKPKLKWLVRKSLLEGEGEGDTIEAALANMPIAETIRTKAIAAAIKKIAETEVELAKLQKEED